MLPTTLKEWLERMEKLHPVAIDMGLDRVVKVRDSLGLAFAGPVITVGGTNGKGSTCAMLEAVLLAAGYRVGLYTSPHLLRYNERVRIDGVPVDDGRLCEAFSRVEQSRDGVSLTYFEFGTLAAWQLFCDAKLDVLVMEVGLGGRLDAVNAFDPDCAVVTSIGIDHVDYLGPTRESIGFEKAGIFRPGRAAICGDPHPPHTLIDHAMAIGADLQILGRDFGYLGDRQQWKYWGRALSRASLAPPALRGAMQLANAATALAALDVLRDKVPVSMQAVREGLAQVELPGRFQVMPGLPSVVLDVAHNPQAAAVLAKSLADQGFFANTRAVVGMLADKDMAGVVSALRGKVDEWHLASLQGPRAASASQLRKAIDEAQAGGTVFMYPSPREAYTAARERCAENDRIVVFGSFLTVAEIASIHSNVLTT